ncbi:glutamate-1-semialdehyde 2,1-aminomutase [Desulfotomaculum sp. 1211_IL3151]|uniref:glutamate-1-semialdehyde 2,1-aminomutase n=1 Tax=Desulfotomaculum sp. 1211_IL3151 TaxID=3084055 RepID=UPI002FDA3AC8
MAPSYQKSQELFDKAQRVIPGGVNSPVRAFKSVDMDPPFIARGDGSHMWDMDGNEYIDYVCSWGPLILGHRHPAVVQAIQRCLERGTTYGAPTDLEVTLAEKVAEALPAVEMVRMVNSGTEATMSALRLARAYTNRNKIVKFEGCYHGHHDSLLIKAGSGALTHGVPTSPGVPEDIAGNTINACYNDLELLEKIFTEVGSDIAAVIVEPLAGNMGVVAPAEGFLQGLRSLCNKYGALLIFDEVITGFRLGYGGAQAYYNVLPDLTCLGKIIGGGLPVGAYGGPREIMQMISPAGPVYQAGTLSGNPLAMTAGIATLVQLQQPGVYEELDRKSALLAQGLAQAAQAANVAVSFNRTGSLQTCFFTREAVRDFASAASSDTKNYGVFFRSMLEQGIYLAPSQFEASFVSLAHTEKDIEKTVEAAFKAFKAVAEKE